MVRFSLPSETDVARSQEPIVLIRVDWPGSGTHYYADRDYGVWSGRILEYSGVTSQKTRDNVGNVSQCSVKIDDFDSIIKVTMDITSPEGAFAYVYLHYRGDDASTRELFRGRVSNFKWSEGTRECTFEIVSVIESLYVGFVVTDDYNLDPNNDVAVGKEWPLVFGKVAHIPAVFVQAIPRGKLKDHIYLTPTAQRLYTLVGGSSAFDANDWASGFEMVSETSLERVIDASIETGSTTIGETNEFIVHDSKKFPHNETIYLNIDGVIFKGKFPHTNPAVPIDYDTFKVESPNYAKFSNVLCDTRPLATDDKDFDNPKVIWLKDSNIDLSGCHTYNHYTVTHKDPATRTTKSHIESYHNICVRQEGRKCWFKYPFMKATMTGSTVSTLNPAWGLAGATSKLDSVFPIATNGLLLELDELVTGLKEKFSAMWKTIRGNEKGSKSPFSPLLRQLDLVQYLKSAFWSASPGAKVTQWNPELGDIYIANCFPSTEIHGVYGVRTDAKTGEQLFVQIPKSFYTVNLSRATTLPGVPNVTTIEFPRALETFDLGWQFDRVFVTLTSTLSNNVATILEWVFDTYTTYATDGSFAALAATLDQYPANFAYLKSTNAIDFAKEVAWQARCGLILDASVAKMRYLSATPPTNFNMDENSTEHATIELGVTPIDSITTQIRAKYVETYNPLIEPKTIVYNNNIGLYGIREQDVDFYIYNSATLIRKTLTFWGYRYSNSWRTARISGFNNLMSAEVFDTLQLDYSTGIIPGLGLKTVVEAVEFDTTGSRVTVNVWLPSFPGETGYAPSAWQSEGLDSTYLNEADRITLTDVCLFKTEDNLDLGEVMRELRKLETSTYSLGKIVAIDPSKPTLKQVLIMNNGPFKDPDPVQTFWMYDTSPHHDLKMGDFVQCQRGQDGIDYITKYEMQPHFAQITAGTLTVNSYTAKILRPGASSGFTQMWPWLVEDQDRGSESLAVDQTVTITNLCEVNNPVKGLLRIGDVVQIRPYANDTLVDNTDGFWYTATPVRSTFDAKITASSAINGGIRFQYTIQLGHWDMASAPGTWVVDSSTTIYAYNSLEDLNTFTGDGTIGTGNTVNSATGVVNSGDCILLPLPAGYVTVTPRGKSGSTPYFTIINAANSAQ